MAQTDERGPGRHHDMQERRERLRRVAQGLEMRGKHVEAQTTRDVVAAMGIVLPMEEMPSFLRDAEAKLRAVLTRLNDPDDEATRRFHTETADRIRMLADEYETIVREYHDTERMLSAIRWTNQVEVSVRYSHLHGLAADIRRGRLPALCGLIETAYRQKYLLTITLASGFGSADGCYVDGFFSGAGTTPSPGEYNVLANSHSVLWHELGHALEAALPDRMLEYVLRWRGNRGAMANSDLGSYYVGDFASTYVGKAYKARATFPYDADTPEKRSRERSATEVISTALEWAFGERTWDGLANTQIRLALAAVRYAASQVMTDEEAAAYQESR